MLADRQDQRVERDLELGIGHVVGDLAARGVAIATVFGTTAHQSGQLPVLDVQSVGLGQFHDPDTFHPAGMDLLRIGGHLVYGPPINERYLRGADPPGGPNAVHRRISGSDDSDPGANGDGSAFAHAAQETQRIHDPLRVLTVQIEPLGQLSSHCHENGLVLVGPQIPQREIDAGSSAVANLDSQLCQNGQVLVDLVLGGAGTPESPRPPCPRRRGEPRRWSPRTRRSPAAGRPTARRGRPR